MKTPPARPTPTRSERDASESEHSLSSDVIRWPLVKRVAVIDSRAASRITWHAHPFYELIFLLDGGTAYEFDDERTVELPGGHFLVIPPGSRHRGLGNVRQPVRLCGLLFDPRPKSREYHGPFQREELKILERQFARNPPQAWRMSPELRRLVRQLKVQIGAVSSEPLWSATLRTTLAGTLLEAARQLGAANSAPPTVAVQRAIQFMDEHLAESVSMTQVALAAACSRARLFQIFKDSTGMTPNDYLLRRRVARAQHRLRTQLTPVTRIALDCGFSTSQYFSHVFRKYTGVSPSAFRQQSRTHRSQKSD